MAEDTLQFEWIVLIKLGLEACFVDRDDVFEAIAELRENRRRIIQLSMKLQDAEDRAETAELQANLSLKRAMNAEERADKLAERLRALGINPDEE